MQDFVLSASDRVLRRRSRYFFFPFKPLVRDQSLSWQSTEKTNASIRSVATNMLWWSACIDWGKLKWHSVSPWQLESC
jgi:hypothetical protein